MKKYYEIILESDSFTKYNNKTTFRFNGDSFSERTDSKIYETESEAQKDFDSIDKSFLIKDGFKNFRVEIFLNEDVWDESENLIESNLIDSKIIED